MESQKKLEKLKSLSIKKEEIRQKINDLRRQKAKLEQELDDLVQQMILED